MKTDNQPDILDIRNLTVSFPGVLALDDVSLRIASGETRILVGENGAGKSSLIKTLSGVYKPDRGQIFLEGQPYNPHTPHDAIKAGVRVVYQEFNLLPYLSVAENIFFEKLPAKWGMVDHRTLNIETQKLLDDVGLPDLSPSTPVEALGVAQMQLVEIAKSLSSEGRILVLDEPTATLTPPEIDKLFGLLGKLKKRGVTIIYISHRLQEVFEIGDRITVLRNGCLVDTRDTKDLSVPEIVRMMIGRDMSSEYPFQEDILPGKELLRVENLRYVGNRHAVDFSVRRGEILGIAGLVGSGRTETMRALFGADAREQGRIILNGRELNISNPRNVVSQGLCLLTEDRKTQGLILDMSCKDNISITDFSKVSRLGLIRRSTEIKVAEKLKNDLAIKTPSVGQLVRNLSGGNQQKVVLAKWLLRDTEVFIVDEPTRGIDVGAKYEIYLLLWRLAAKGKGIIMVSSDLPELLGVCHRMLIFSDGRIAGDLDRKDFDQETILSYAYSEYLEGIHS